MAELSGLQKFTHAPQQKPAKKSQKIARKFCRFQKYVYLCIAIGKNAACNQRENSSVGRARPCQGRGRGFESRFSLKKMFRVH